MTLIIKPTTITEAAVAGVRILTVLIGGSAAIGGFVSKHDLAGLIAYLQSQQFIPVAGAIAAVATFGYGLWRTYKTKKSLLAVAEAVPDEIATILPKNGNQS